MKLAARANPQISAFLLVPNVFFACPQAKAAARVAVPGPTSADRKTSSFTQQLWLPPWPRSPPMWPCPVQHSRKERLSHSLNSFGCHPGHGRRPCGHARSNICGKKDTLIHSAALAATQAKVAACAAMLGPAFVEIKTFSFTQQLRLPPKPRSPPVWPCTAQHLRG